MLRFLTFDAQRVSGFEVRRAARLWFLTFDAQRGLCFSMRSEAVVVDFEVAVEVRM